MRKWRNIATRLRRNAIKQYWKNKSDDLKENPRSFFKTLTPFLNDKKGGETVISFKEGNVIEQDQHKITELFAKYFSSIAGGDCGPPIGQSDTNHCSVNKIRIRWPENEFSFRNVNRAEVLGTLEKLNPHKATGHDNISPRILRMAASEIATPLTTLYNKIISEGIWPDEWKWGEWTPVFKKDDPLVKSNYRPVTVLVSVDKVFETLLGSQLGILTDRVFDDFNSAYRKSYSCEITLVRLVEDWKKALDSNHAAGLLSTFI